MKKNAEKRRSGALSRLEVQLSANHKIDKETKEIVPLSGKDRLRIIKEMVILKERI